LSIPDEFFEYLDGCADRVLKIISRKGDSGIKQLDDVFELRDRYFSQYQNDKKMIEAYIRVKMIKEKDKSKTMDEIFSIVAKEVMHKEDDPNYDGAGTISHHYYKIDNKIEKEGHFPTIIHKIKIENKNK